MRSERFYPARAFPFYGALLLTLRDLLIDVNPAGLCLFVEARVEGRTTGGGGRRAFAGEGGVSFFAEKKLINQIQIIDFFHVTRVCLCCVFCGFLFFYNPFI